MPPNTNLTFAGYTMEDARFVWPQQNSAVVELTVQQLHWLLDGIDLAAMRGHKAVSYQRAA